MATNYLRMEYLLGRIDQPNRTACEKLFSDNRKLWKQSPGSTNNHQAWPGGYLDHITEVMNIAIAIYESLSAARMLPFSLSDALLVLFLHDLEKPWKYERKTDGQLHHKAEMQTKGQHNDFRLKKAEEYGIVLTEQHKNGIKYAEGELDDYSGKTRVMGPLAAFVHMCDVCSARIWFDQPAEQKLAWMHAQRWRSS